MSQIKEELIEILNDWIDKKIDAAQVHEWGENHYPFSEEPFDEVTNEVLGDLDMLDMDLITVEDAPFYLNVLDKATSGIEARNLINKYNSSNKNMAERKKQLANIPLYAKFCKN